MSCRTHARVHARTRACAHIGAHAHPAVMPPEISKVPAAAETTAWPAGGTSRRVGVFHYYLMGRVEVVVEVGVGGWVVLGSGKRARGTTMKKKKKKKEKRQLQGMCGTNANTNRHRHRCTQTHTHIHTQPHARTHTHARTRKRAKTGGQTGGVRARDVHLTHLLGALGSPWAACTWRRPGQTRSRNRIVVVVVAVVVVAAAAAVVVVWW
jgi:hypothetical protein